MSIGEFDVSSKNSTTLMVRIIYSSCMYFIVYSDVYKIYFVYVFDKYIVGFKNACVNFIIFCGKIS